MDTELTLSAKDRCDYGKCGARAYVRVFFASGSDLLMCGHHFHDAEVELRKIALDIVDETSSLSTLRAGL